MVAVQILQVVAGDDRALGQLLGSAIGFLAVQETLDPAEGIVIKKPLVNGPGVRSAFRGASLRGTPVKFGFTVTGPNNYSQTFELAPGESKELKNLYFGEYKVEETAAHGYTATYSVTDGKVTQLIHKLFLNYNLHFSILPKIGRAHV